MTTKIKRHRWTEDELAYMDSVVADSDSKMLAFEKIAKKMKLSKGAVAQTYYASKRNGTKKIATSVPRASGSVGVAMNPVLQGRPFDWTGCSEGELLEAAREIHTEVERRRAALEELSELF